MQLSIVILNYKVQYFLELCLISVQKAIQNLDAEIIVVDNFSNDGSYEMVKTKFPNVKLIENAENLGFPKGNNIGVAVAKGKYICILNPDTVVAEDTFELILKLADGSQQSADGRKQTADGNLQTKICNLQSEICNLNTGIIGCKLIDGTGNFLPESKRGVPTPWVAITKIFGLYKISNFFGKYYAQHLTENQSGKVDILVGAFMILERELYNKMGGFDENCFMYSDDIDLSYSALKLGLTNYYFAETSVIHFKGESTIRDEKYRKRFAEAMQFFYKKHFSQSFLFDFVMKIGTLIFSLFKKNQQKNTSKNIDEFIVFSKENQILKFEEKTLYFTDFEQFENNKITNYEIIFDTNSFSFKEVIAFMEANKSKNISFKNYIPASNFMIGSNHANDLGQIIQV